MPFIIYPQQDNKLAVIIPSGDYQDAIKDVPQGVEYAVVDDLGDLDNEYFDAFEYRDLGISCNIDKAKAIHLDKFRAARAPKLAALDIDYSRADESGDVAKKAEIAFEKQVLRDVTKVELPSDLPSLKEFWPLILGPRPSTQP
jgi:hypothetical protein